MKIDNYEFGKIVINGKEYSNDVIIFPDHVKGDWWRDEGHVFSVKDLEEAFNAEPEILILGIGHDGMVNVKDEVMEHCNKKNIQTVVEKTGKAVETFNKLSGEDKKVVAALHLTC